MWIVAFIVLVALWAAWVAYAQNQSNDCNQDCDQGRNCDCDANWPFPTRDKP